MYIQIEESFDKDLNDAEYFDVNHQEKLSSFGPINTVNLFVGANNSGKSRTLRQLLKKPLFLSTNESYNLKDKVHNAQNILEKYTQTTLKQISIVFSNNGYENFLEYIQEKKLDLFEEYFKNNVMVSCHFNRHDIDKLTSIISSKQDNAFYAILKKSLMPIVLKLKFLHNFSLIKPSLISFDNFGNVRYDNDSIIIIKEIYSSLSWVLDFELNSIEPTRIYIPILRSSQSLYFNNGRTNSDIFKETVVKNYEIEKTEIFSGLGLYGRLKKEIKSYILESELKNLSFF